MSLHVIMELQFNMRQWSETLAHQITEFSDNQNSCFSRPPYPTTGWGGKMETEPFQLDLETEPFQSDLQTDGCLSAGWNRQCTDTRRDTRISTVVLPPIWKKKVCGWLQLTICGCKQVEWWKESVRLSRKFLVQMVGDKKLKSTPQPPPLWNFGTQQHVL